VFWRERSKPAPPSSTLRAPSTHRLSNARPPSPLEIAGGVLISILPQKVPTRDRDPLCLPDYPAFTVRPYGFSVNTVYSFAFRVFPARVYIFSRAREVRRPWTPQEIHNLAPLYRARVPAHQGPRVSNKYTHLCSPRACFFCTSKCSAGPQQLGGCGDQPFGREGPLQNP